MEQHLTNSEKEFLRVRSMTKSLSKKKLKGKKDPFFKGPIEDRRGMSRPMAKVPKFKQGPHESDMQFLRRMEVTSKKILTQSQFADQYQVEFGKDGKIIKERTKSAAKNTQRLKEKKHRKKEQKQQKVEEKQSGFERFEDKVEFGEVAMAPPQLNAIPRKAPTQIMKPGVRSLLLKEIIRDNQTSSGHQSSGQRSIGKTVRRKMLSPAQQIQMDAERNSAILHYRELKAKKQKHLDL